MATRRQREVAAAPRPAANAAGLRNQTATVAARSRLRNETAATPVAVAVAAPSGPRNQTAAAAAAAPTCRPHARNRRALGEIGNQVNTPVADREANRCRVSRRLSSQPNVTAIAPAPPPPAAAEGANTSRTRAVSGEDKKLTKGATTMVTRTMSKTDATVDSLMKRVAAAEATTAEAVQELGRTVSQMEQLNDTYVKLTDDYVKVSRDYHRQLLFTTEVMQINRKLQAMVVKNETELQKERELNLRLCCEIDQKEAQLQAMSEQCKDLALNSN